MHNLPRQRAAVLAFIRKCIEREGSPPTLVEIAEHCGFASHNSASKHVKQLADAGLIEVSSRHRRSIRLAGSRNRPSLLSLPVLGRVAAGVPTGTDIGTDRSFAVDPAMFSPRPDYLLKVEGDSMIDDAILDGDFVAVKRANDARSGQIVIARLDGGITIKRLERGTRAIRLLSRNSAYAPITVERGQDFAIEGLFCGLIRGGGA